MWLGEQTRVCWFGWKGNGDLIKPGVLVSWVHKKICTLLFLVILNRTWEEWGGCVQEWRPGDSTYSYASQYCCIPEQTGCIDDDIIMAIAQFLPRTCHWVWGLQVVSYRTHEKFMVQWFREMENTTYECSHWPSSSPQLPLSAIWR